MHPRITELLQYIDAERSNLRAAVDTVPSERRSEAPNHNGWSVAGVLEHLSVVEARVTVLFRSKVAEARAAGVGTDADTSPILPTLDVPTMVDRGNRLNSPNSLQPKANLDADAAWEALDRTRHEFRDAVIQADGLALGEITHPHLYFGAFSLYKWIAFIGSHEARHAAQIREIGAALVPNRA